MNVDNLCWLLMFGGGNKEHEKQTIPETLKTFTNELKLAEESKKNSTEKKSGRG